MHKYLTHNQDLVQELQSDRETIRAMSRCAIPMYYYEMGDSIHFGTGTYLQVADRRFIVTAAHVLDELDDVDRKDEGRIYLPSASDELVSLQGMAFRTAKVGGERRKDKIDIGTIEIPQDYQVINWFHPASMNWMLVNDRVHPKDICFSGYPEKKNQTKWNKEKDIVKYAILGSESPHSTLEKKGFSDPAHIGTTFFPSCYDADGGKTTAVAPHGMSGGPVFARVPVGDGTQVHYPIIGIGIEYHTDIGLLVGVRIDVVMEILRSNYPDLSRYIPQTRIMKVNVHP